MVLKRTNWLFIHGFLDLLSVLTGRLLGQEDGLDVGNHSALGDGDAGKKFVELLVVPDGELEVPRVDPGLLVVPGSVPGELEDLGSEVLHDGGEVDRSSGPNSLGVATLPEQTVDPSHGKLQSSTARAGLGLGPDFLTAGSSSGHASSFCFS